RKRKNKRTKQKEKRRNRTCKNKFKAQCSTTKSQTTGLRGKRRDAKINKMLDAGVIRHSKSPWASQIVKVRKPDGSIRICGNYIPLNEVMEPDSFPLPDIPLILDWTGQFKLKTSTRDTARRRIQKVQG